MGVLSINNEFNQDSVELFGEISDGEKNQVVIYGPGSLQLLMLGPSTQAHLDGSPGPPQDCSNGKKVQPLWGQTFPLVQSCPSHLDSRSERKGWPLPALEHPRGRVFARLQALLSGVGEVKFGGGEES